jgi:hypothetical protein
MTLTSAVLVPVLASTLVFTASPCDPEAGPESLLGMVLRIAGIPAVPRDVRGKIDDFEGDLYLTTADGKTARRRLTEGGGFRSPVFAPDDEHVLALWHGQLMRVATDRSVVVPEPLLDLPGVTWLGGLSEIDPNVLVVLRDKRGHRGPAVVCLDSLRLAELPSERREINDLLRRLRSAARLYGHTVVVTQAHPDAKGSDVRVELPDQEAIDVSRCGGDFCGQGALSVDGRRVVFVRSRLFSTPPSVRNCGRV